jgi:hypothetical protein
MKRLIVMLIVLGFAGSAWAVALDADGVKADLGGVGPLSGWTKVTSTNTFTIESVNFDFDHNGGNNGGSIRTGTTGDDGVKDFYGNDDPGTAGVWTLKISNLDAGDYTLVSYHNDSSFRHSEGWSAGNVTSAVSGGDSDSGTATTDAADYSEALALTVTFSSTGTSDVTSIAFGNTSGSCQYLGGFHLTPEPATVALLGLGSLVLLRRRR